jgi:hypothetical protein
MSPEDTPFHQILLYASRTWRVVMPLNKAPRPKSLSKETLK